MKSNETSAALTEQQAQSLAVVQSYFDASIRGDLTTIESLFTDNIVEVIPLGPTGDLAPFATYTGKDEVMGYQQVILDNFSQIRYIDSLDTVSANGDAVFFEAKGDAVGAEGGKPYKNVYVFKFTVQNGQIARIDEYANPVTYSKLMGLPVG